MDLKPAPAIVSERLKSQFTPAYLTLTSIIQGVALAVLAARVEATYTQFDATARSSSSIVVRPYPCHAQKAHRESTDIRRYTLSSAGSAVNSAVKKDLLM